MSIRYQQLGYAALNVSDLDRSERFYVDVLGLESTGRGPGDCRLLRCSDKRFDIVLHRGVPGLKRIGFEMESPEALDALSEVLERTRVSHRRVPAEECAAYGLRRCVRMLEPHTGATFDFYDAQQELGGRPFRPTVAKIQRLGHVVLKTPAFAEAVAFFTRIMNFRISDELDGIIAFMRCFPNPWHHTFALTKADSRILHHVNFMVTEVDDIGRAMWRFKKANVPIVNGPGRHPPSGSMFYYFLDPDGITLEYSFGMEAFPEVSARKPRVMEPVRASIDFWDADVDPRKSSVGVIEADPELVRLQRVA